MTKGERKGQTMIIAIVFVFLALNFGIVLSSYLMRENDIIDTSAEESKALWLAEAGIQKALWCFDQISPTNCGGTYGADYTGETGVALNGGTFNITVTGDDVRKEVVSHGVYSGQEKTVRIYLEKKRETVQIPEVYAVVSGAGGFTMDNAATLEGNIYLNSDLDCGGATISGDISLSGTAVLSDCHITGTAKAYSIADSIIDGDAYYQSISNTVVLGNSYPGSPLLPFLDYPITDEMISQWKADAEAGGVYSGDDEIDQNTSLGPLKITGDLDIKKTLTLTGILYVQGVITIKSGGRIQLDDTYYEDSGVIITDSAVDITSGSGISGTDEGGVVTLISTASGNNFSIGTTGGSFLEAILFAPNGQIELNSGNKAFQVMGESVVLHNGAHVSIDESLQSMTFLRDVTIPFSWGFDEGTRVE